MTSPVHPRVRRIHPRFAPIQLAVVAGALLVASAGGPASAAGASSGDAPTPAVRATADTSSTAVPGGDDPVRPAEARGTLGTERLSDERRVSRWAYARQRRHARTSPDLDAAPVARLRLATEDGEPEVYLVLRSRRVGDKVWLQVRLPMRPNGRTGWVLREALGRLKVVTTRLTVDRRRLRAVLLRDGRRVWSAPVGVGAPDTPTPAGRFYVRERLRPPPGTLYGAWAFGTSAYSVLSDWPGGGVVGIHGTNQPDLIPGRPSHGCVRVRDPAIRRLARLMPVGTPVRIR